MQRTFCFLVWLLLSACASAPIAQVLDRVKPGMAKAEVLEVAGNPKRTYREHGQDHWIYVYFQNNREMSREVIFEAGKVEKVTPARGKPNWEKELEPSLKSDSGFKTLDEGP